MRGQLSPRKRRGLSGALPTRGQNLPVAASAPPSSQTGPRDERPLSRDLPRSAAQASAARPRARPPPPEDAARAPMVHPVIQLIFGLASRANGIYGPWAGDPRAPLFVAVARTAGIMSLLLGVLAMLVVLVSRGMMDPDVTVLATALFAAGAAAPVIGRGSWLLIDIGTMFGDTMHTSYRPCRARAGRGGSRARRGDVGAIGAGGFAKTVGLVWVILMRHNDSARRFAPGLLALSVLDAAADAVYGAHASGGGETGATGPGRRRWRRRWDWSARGWSTRWEACFRTLLLAPAVLLVAVQAATVLAEGLVLGLGSAWVSAAVAAHMDILAEPPSSVSRDLPLECVLRDLICCDACPPGHRCVDKGGEASAGDDGNNKLLSRLMPRIRAKSAAGKAAHPHSWDGGQVVSARVAGQEAPGPEALGPEAPREQGSGVPWNGGHIRVMKRRCCGCLS